MKKVRNIYKTLGYVLSVLVLAVSTTVSGYASPAFMNYPISSSYTAPGQTTVAGGSLWYIENSGSARAHIGNMTTSGATTDYDIRTLSGNPNLTLYSLTTGPGDDVWFNGYTSGGSSPVAGFLDITTGTVTLYSSGIPSYNNIGSIVTGSDGNLYYYIKNANSNHYDIVKVTSTTGTTTTLASYNGNYSSLTGIAAGPDGRVWVMDSFMNRIYVFAVSGGSGSTFTVPSSIFQPGGIRTGGDGNLWFGESHNTNITKVTTSGSFTTYTLPSGVSASEFTAGPDGATWFANNSSSTKKIGRLTSSGSTIEYTVPGTSVNNVGSLTLGPDGAIWFTYIDSGGGKLGRLIVTPDFTSHPISSSYGVPGRTTVAGGSLWYIEGSSSGLTHIGNMTTSGTTTDYNIRTLSGDANLTLRSLTTGSDGNVWFNAASSGGWPVAGRLNISTGTVALYPSGIASYGNFGSIVTGSDGNLYYYIKNASSNYWDFVKVNTTTGTTTTVTSYNSNYSNLTGIAAGPNGKVWIMDTLLKRIYVRGVSGGGNSTYTVPASISGPYGIHTGGDGNLWFGESYSTNLTKVTTSGSFTTYTLPSGVAANELVAGPDGATWFVNSNAKKIGRLTSSGGTTEYAIPGSSLSNIGGLTLGPDGAIWFTYTDSGGGKLGRLGY